MIILMRMEVLLSLSILVSGTCLASVQNNVGDDCRCDSGWRKRAPGIRPCGSSTHECPDSQRVDATINSYCEPLTVPSREITVRVETRIGGAECDAEVGWDLQPRIRDITVILHGAVLGPCTGMERHIGFTPICWFQTATCENPAKTLTRWSTECLPSPFIMPLPPPEDCNCGGNGRGKIIVIDPVTGESEDIDVEVMPEPAPIPLPRITV